MATSKKTLEQQIADAKKTLAELEARAKSGRLDEALSKHKTAIAAIYNDLKAATGMQRGVDTTILAAVAEAMGMRGMTISKKVQQRAKAK
jgi:ribosomal protein L29